MATAAIIAAYISIAATVASTAAAVIVDHKKAKGAAAAADANAEIAANNAQQARMAGDVAAAQVRNRNRRVRARQRAIYGKAGVDQGDSAGLVIFDSAVEGELNALNVASRFNAQAQNQEAQSNLFKLESSNATANLGLGMAGTIIGGIGGVAGGVAQLKAAGDGGTEDPGPTFGGGATPPPSPGSGFDGRPIGASFPKSTFG